MKKLIKSKLFLQVIVASLVATLATAGIVGAVTTIGANINTAGTLTVDTDTLYVDATNNKVGVGSTTPFATLSVDSDAGNRAFLVGSSTRNQLLIDANMDLFVNDDDLVVDWSSGYVGIGTTTPGFALGVTNTSSQLGLAYNGTNITTFTVNSGGDLTILPSGGDSSITGTLSVSATSTLSTDLRVDTSTLVVDSFNNLVGIGTTTPYATLSVNNVAGKDAFVIGSSTATWLKVDSSGLLTVAKGATFSDTLAAGNSTITGTLTASTKLGAASTTPLGQLGIGTGGVAATSTISAGKFCMYAAQENGTMVYVTLGAAQANGQPFATSTTSCF